VSSAAAAGELGHSAAAAGLLSLGPSGPLGEVAPPRPLVGSGFSACGRWPLNLSLGGTVGAAAKKDGSSHAFPVRDVPALPSDRLCLVPWDSCPVGGGNSLRPRNS